MILSLSLIDLPQMTVEQRIRQWTSNLVGYLGAGLTHERFRDWVEGNPPINALAPETQQISFVEIGERISGRMFFHDLFSLLYDSKLSVSTLVQYERVVFALLRSVWTRLINSGVLFDIKNRKEQVARHIFGLTYEIDVTRTSYMDSKWDAGNWDPNDPFKSTWVPPLK